MNDANNEPVFVDNLGNTLFRLSDKEADRRVMNRMKPRGFYGQ